MDQDTVMKKLHKVGNPAQLWGDSAMVTQLGGANDGKCQPQAKDSGGTVQQQHQKDVNFDKFSYEDFEDDGLDGDPRMMMEMKPMGMPPAGAGAYKKGGGNGNDGGKKGGGGNEIPVHMKVDANNGGNLAGQGKKGGGYLGRPMIGDTPPPQTGMMMSPHNMIGQIRGARTMGGMVLGHPHMGGGCAGMPQQGGGMGTAHGMPSGGVSGDIGFFPGTGGSGTDGMAAAKELLPMWQPLQQQQQQMIMMNGHDGYPPLPASGYEYGCSHPTMPQHLPAYYYPMPPQHPHDIVFSDDSPNSCSVM